MSNWYYAQDSQQQGPINEAELKEMLATGKLAASTLVWREGMENWAMASSVSEFQFRPPPMPSQPKPVAAVAEAAPTPAPTSEAGSVPAPEEAPAVADPEDVEKNKVFGILAYISILFLVPLVAAPQSPFAKYHANQGLILFLATLVLYIGVSIIGAVPVLGLVVLILWPVVGLGSLAFTIIGILSAAKGEMKPLPFIGQYKILS